MEIEEGVQGRDATNHSELAGPMELGIILRFAMKTHRDLATLSRVCRGWLGAIDERFRQPYRGEDIREKGGWSRCT